MNIPNLPTSKIDDIVSDTHESLHSDDGPGADLAYIGDLDDSLMVELDGNLDLGHLVRDIARAVLTAIEADEWIGVQDQAGGVTRINSDRDPREEAIEHIGHRAKTGHVDTLVHRYVTPWEET